MTRLNILFKAGRYKHCMWTKTLRLSTTHSRAYAKAPCFIRSRTDNCPTLRTPTDNNRSTSQLGAVSLLNGCIESIHIHMNNLSIVHLDLFSNKSFELQSLFQ